MIVKDPRNGREAVAKCNQCDYWARARGEAPGVPEDERQSRVENFVPVEPITTGPIEKRHCGTVDALRQANHWLAGVHPDLYLWGPCGVGKTRLACSLLNARWVAGDRVLFKRCTQLLMRELIPGREEDVYDVVTKMPVLCLDDVGGQQGSDFARRMLVEIFDARAAARRRTVWTSNLNLDQLAEFFQDDRLTSRIVGRSKVVEMGGRDWRLRQQRQRETSKGAGS
jgi:DNA replication protein DnaC